MLCSAVLNKEKQCHQINHTHQNLILTRKVVVLRRRPSAARREFAKLPVYGVSRVFACRSHRRNANVID